MVHSLRAQDAPPEGIHANTGCKYALRSVRDKLLPNNTSSNPTLSYTRRLEAQVRDLQTLLQQAKSARWPIPRAGCTDTVAG